MLYYTLFNLLGLDPAAAPPATERGLPRPSAAGSVFPSFSVSRDCSICSRELEERLELDVDPVGLRIGRLCARGLDDGVKRIGLGMPVI